MKSKHTKVDISSSKQKIDPILDKQSKLLKRALSYVKNYEHAKDFVQDTLVAVWLTKTKIKNPVAYAKTVLEREIWKEAKKHSRTTCYLEEIPNNVKEGLKIIPVEQAEEVLTYALVQPLTPIKETPKDKKKKDKE